MDAVASGGFARWARTQAASAKSCGPGAATVASIRAGPCWRGNGDKKRRSPGRARISRQTIARGKPGCLGCTCLIRVRFRLPLHTVLRAQSAPGFPCALSTERDNEIAKLGQIMSRECFRLFEIVSAYSIVVPDKRATSERDPGPITTGKSFAKAVAPASQTTTPCGYGSRRAPGRQRSKIAQRSPKSACPYTASTR